MKKPMKNSMKKPVKKADGGMMVGIPRGEAGGPGPAIRPMPMPKPGNRNMGRAMPMPNPKAREAASPNARFNRPATGGPMSPARPAMPAMPRSMPGAAPRGAGRTGPITTMPISPLKKGGMPMRKAKGGMAKGKKK